MHPVIFCYFWTQYWLFSAQSKKRWCFVGTWNSHKFTWCTVQYSTENEAWCLFSLLFVIFKYSVGVQHILFRKSLHKKPWSTAHCIRINYSGTLFGDHRQQLKKRNESNVVHSKQSNSIQGSRCIDFTLFRLRLKSIINWNLFNVCEWRFDSVPGSSI